MHWKYNYSKERCAGRGAGDLLSWELCTTAFHYSCQQEKHSTYTWKTHRGFACWSKQQTRLRYPINFMWICKASLELINFPLLWFPEALVSSTQVLYFSFLLTPFLFPCHHTAWQTLPDCSLLWRYSVPLHHGVIKQKVTTPLIEICSLYNSNIQTSTSLFNLWMITLCV